MPSREEITSFSNIADDNVQKYLYYMDNIFVWCAALSLHPFCLDYISLGLGNITKNTVSFFFLLPILRFLIL